MCLSDTSLSPCVCCRQIILKCNVTFNPLVHRSEFPYKNPSIDTLVSEVGLCCCLRAAPTLTLTSPCRGPILSYPDPQLPFIEGAILPRRERMGSRSSLTVAAPSTDQRGTIASPNGNCCLLLSGSITSGHTSTGEDFSSTPYVVPKL